MRSSVRWEGLTKLIMDMKYGVPQRMTPAVNQYTKDILDLAWQVYVDNLSASGPRTATSGLPVGVRSGTLRAGATKRQVNQYSGELTNDVPYAGFIEEGTQHMPPRRPLGDAVDWVGEMVPGRMGQVLTTVVIEQA
jgi:hypothetical protein